MLDGVLVVAVLAGRHLVGLAGMVLRRPLAEDGFARQLQIRPESLGPVVPLAVVAEILARAVVHRQMLAVDAAVDAGLVETPAPTMR